MSQPRPLPGPLVFLASALIAFHLFAVVILVLAAPSGPWPTPFGSSPALGPQFAGAINNNLTTPLYLQPLRMTHNYHFETNNTDISQVMFEVHLKDRAGNEIAILKFPEERANFWVRHRHSLLAQSLGNDQPVQAPRVERVPSPKVKIWKLVEKESREDQETYIHEDEEEVNIGKITRSRPVYRPSEWSMLLANAYLRYLARNLDELEKRISTGSVDLKAAQKRWEEETQGPDKELKKLPATIRTILETEAGQRSETEKEELAKFFRRGSIELVRHSRNSVPPEALILPNDRLPPGTFARMVARFGEIRLVSNDKGEYHLEK